MKILIVALSFTILSAHHVNAMINVDVDIKTSTNHHECSVYAEGVRDFVKLFINTTNPGEKAWLIEQIDYMKKQLKKCEKNNKKVKHDVGVKVGGSYNFTEK